jgi:radical SAM protein with 4Fe4S-binding SPASM domain
MIPFTRLPVTDRKNLKEILPLKKPFTVLVEPSSRCNFRCIQCFQSIDKESYFTRNRMNMPMERFRLVIDQLKSWDGPKLKVLKLCLYGEPLLNSDFCDMLKIAKEADVAERIETTTNASLLSRRIAEKLVEYQLDYARISIYAPDQKKHEEITGSKILIADIHENLRVLKEEKQRHGSEKPFVSAKMLDTYGPDNDRFMQLYGDVADEVFIDKPHSWIKTEGADFLKKYYKESMPAAADDFKRHSTQRIACPMAFTTMAVRANGDVSPCCVDFIGGTNLGSVDKDNMREIWRSDRWYEFQKMQLENRKQENPSCGRCDFYLSDHYTRDDIDRFDVRKLRLK